VVVDPPREILRCNLGKRPHILVTAVRSRVF
jgi:hypothetical protein